MERSSSSMTTWLFKTPRKGQTTSCFLKSPARFRLKLFQQNCLVFSKCQRRAATPRLCGLNHVLQGISSYSNCWRLLTNTGNRSLRWVLISDGLGKSRIRGTLLSDPVSVLEDDDSLTDHTNTKSCEHLDKLHTYKFPSSLFQKKNLLSGELNWASSFSRWECGGEVLWGLCPGIMFFLRFWRSSTHLSSSYKTSVPTWTQSPLPRAGMLPEYTVTLQTDLLRDAYTSSLLHFPADFLDTPQKVDLSPT